MLCDADVDCYSRAATRSDWHSRSQFGWRNPRTAWLLWEAGGLGQMLALSQVILSYNSFFYSAATGAVH